MNAPPRYLKPEPARHRREMEPGPAQMGCTDMTGLAWREKVQRVTASRDALRKWAGGESMWTWLLAGQTHDHEMAIIELGPSAALWWTASPYDTPQFDDLLMYWERDPDG